MGRTEIRICGLGGQGVVLAGQILGRAAVYDGWNVAQTQSYGAEARGTTAKSEVIISDGRIGFPAVRKCDILLAVSQEALDRNIRDLKEDGLLLFDEDLVKNVPNVNAKIYAVPATRIAEENFGERLYANMVILGALNALTKIVSEESMEKAIVDTVPKNVAAVNLQAYKSGRMLENSYFI
ncbi:MAG: 2-oxoacid:acceptor oxidoreductase family protein [Candidatus Bathyarchaeia archaeon]|nr:2-oxoacid:acceptor oxidoreductase family protein [Candidatus Bathyarchaeota archaeon]